MTEQCPFCKQYLVIPDGEIIENAMGILFIRTGEIKFVKEHESKIEAIKIWLDKNCLNLSDRQYNSLKKILDD